MLKSSLIFGQEKSELRGGGNLHEFPENPNYSEIGSYDSGFESRKWPKNRSFIEICARFFEKIGIFRAFRA